MRILQVIPRFNPKLGGGVNVVFNVSKYLAKRGHEVTVITTDCDGIDKNYIKIMQQEGVEVVPFRNIFNFGLFILSPSMKEWLSKNIKNYDVIHLNGARSFQNNIVSQYAKKYNIPYVLQAHGSILRIVEKQKLKKLYDLIWGYKIYKESSKAIALTNSEAEAYQIMGINRDKIEVIPNGIDSSKFKDLPKRGEFRRKYSIQNNEKIVLYLGRLHKSKGIELLIEAFSELTTKLNNVKLFLVGPDDGYELKLKKLIKDLKIEDKIIFAGLVSENEKIMALIDADVFVTPRFYGFPITFAESCACGLPIITTKEGDSIDWIDDQAGLITGYSKYELCDAIIRVLKDEKLRIRFGEKGKILVKEEFSWNKITEKVEDLYIDSIERV